MCGIVGYVGSQPALDVVLEGLRRLEYRGYDSAGVAVLDGELVVEKRAGRIENLDKAIAAEHPAGSPARTGIGHTRWATHGAPTDRNAHPHLDAANAVAVIHNGIIENFAPLRAELEAAGSSCAARPTPRSSRTCSAAALPEAGGDLAEAVRQVCRRLDGAFTLSSPTGTTRAGWSAARRNSPLVLGVGRRRDVPGQRRGRVRRAHQGRGRARPGPGRGDHAGRLHGHRLRGRAGRRHAVPGRLGPRRRREGRLRLLHAQGDPGAAGRGRRHPAGPVRGRPDRAGRAAAGRAGAARRGQGLRGRLRHGVPLRADREVRDRALDPDPGRGRDGLGVPLPGPGAGPGHAGRRDLAERRDHGHAGGDPARAGAEGAGARRSATPTARRSRGSPTRCSTPGPGRRSGSPRPRRSWPRSPRRSWSGWRWPARRAPSTATRSPASSPRWRRCRR